MDHPGYGIFKKSFFHFPLTHSKPKKAFGALTAKELTQINFSHLTPIFLYRISAFFHHRPLIDKINRPILWDELLRICTNAD
jgi:hypothetical protein